MAIASPYNYAPTGVYSGFPTKDEIQYILELKYPDEYCIMECLVRKESQYCQNMIGDHGLAIGCYQIHIDKHPVSRECAMDFECSAYFTYNKIKDGKGYLWTPYYKCLSQCKGRAY